MPRLIVWIDLLRILRLDIEIIDMRIINRMIEVVIGFGPSGVF